MAILKTRERCLVGRDADIKTVVDAALRGTTSRVLIHGPPGVGKDVIAVEAVLDGRIKRNGALALQAWLQGSTDEMFRRQLVRLFATQFPGVVRGTESDEAATLASITRWLRMNPGWLFVVEDANFECRSLWTCLPAGVGRVIFTSVEDVRAGIEVDGGWASLGITAAVELAPFSTVDSIELWRRMNLFALTMPEVDLAVAEAELEARCNAALAAGGHPDRLTYVAPVARETAGSKKQRHRTLQTGLREHRELSDPRLAAFMDAQLGNLPLAVALNGQTAREVGSAATVIQLFETAKLEQVDRDGRNPVTDWHLLGLYASVRVAVERIKADTALAGADKAAALRLLVALSVLPGRATSMGNLALYIQR